ncbi:MAG TPA: thiamine pyrophosphate-binding protein [Xanthomonadaceae bacterium]
MNASQWLVQALIAEGVDALFGYPGGAIMPFYDALYGSGLKHALVRHEPFGTCPSSAMRASQ